MQLLPSGMVRIMGIDLDLGKVMGKLDGIENLLVLQQKSSDQDRSDNRREHKILFDHLNYINVDILPTIKTTDANFRDHVKNHLSWLKISGILVALIAGTLALIDNIPPTFK